jgi:hypothetical protein
MRVSAGQLTLAESAAWAEGSRALGYRPAMLELRPNCECCGRDLPPASRAARICTYECTFCAECAKRRFGGVCPNCGGELVRRPVRPAAMLARHPASTERHTKAHPECVT